MVYTLDFALALGSSQTGLTLSAQLVDTAGSNVGGAVLTGFTEIGVGNYLWHYASIPDGHRGGVKFSISGGALMAFAAINPEEGENTDAKTSTRSTYAGGDTAGVTELLTRIPDATAGTAGGLPTVDANNYVAGLQGTLNQLDDLNNAAAAPAMITAQEVRDALKLAPTAGAPAAGSIDQHLDDIPTNPYTGTPPSAADVASQVRTELATELAHLDDDITSRLAATDYTAPDNAGIAAIPTTTLTQQNVADALKLAPSVGTPAAGSVDADLDTLVGRVGGVETPITVTSPVATSGAIELLAGDDYLTADGRQLSWTEPDGGNWPDLSGGVTFYAISSPSAFSKAMTVVSNSTPKQVTLDLTAAETATLPGRFDFYLRALDAHSPAHKAQFVRGMGLVK